MKKKTNWKKISIQVAVGLGVVVVAFLLYKAYTVVYSHGYEAGVRNALVCAASERDKTLQALCK
jgi:hypothetical protein